MKPIAFCKQIDCLFPTGKDRRMPHFVTIGYGDRAGYDRTPAAVRDTAHRHDAELQEQGALMGIAGRPVQVRNPDATGVETRDGPFLSSALPVAGFAIIEAVSLAEAVDIASRAPCAVAHGVVEVWPLQQV
jgi:hypothetical protein